MNIILAGVGGQGTVLASKLIALASKEIAHTAETIGMAQRGGSVFSHVRLGEGHSPLIPKGHADVLIGFEPSEAVRCFPYLKPNGVAVVSSTPIKPVSASLSPTVYDGAAELEYLKTHAKTLIVVDGAAICDECGSDKVLNVALLGAAYTFLELSIEDICSALGLLLPEKLQAVNLHALELGTNY